MLLTPEMSSELSELIFAIREGNLHRMITLIGNDRSRYGFALDPEDARYSELLRAVIENMCPTTLAKFLKFYAGFCSLKNRYAINTAVRTRLKEIIKTLLGRGDVSGICRCGKPVLYDIAFPTEPCFPKRYHHGDDETIFYILNIMKDLLPRGRPVTAKIRNALLFLNLTIQNENKDTLQILAENCFDVNLKTPTGMILHFVAEEGITNICELLIERGADVNAKDEDGLTPLHVSFRNKRKDIVEILLRCGADIEMKAKNGQTALHFAASEGMEEICSLLIERGADVNAISKNGSGYTPLHLAIGNGHKHTAQLLLQHGADVKLKSRCGVTPLHTAAAEGLEEVCNLLIESGANVNANTEDGLTALHVAALNGQACVVDAILHSGALIDSVDVNGNTALHLAVLARQNVVIMILIENGSDLDIKNKYEKTAFHLIDDFEYTTIFLSNLCEDSFYRLDEYHKYHVYSKWDAFGDRSCGWDHDYSINQRRILFAIDIVQEHLIKMDVAGLNKGNFRELGVTMNIDARSQFQQKCEEEITRIRGTRIVNTTVTLHDILTKTVDQVVGYARNENIVQAFTLNNHQGEFPMYTGLIKSNFKKAMRRRKLLDESDRKLRVWMKNTRFFKPFPHTCVGKILSFLSDENLRNMTEVHVPEHEPECCVRRQVDNDL